MSFIEFRNICKKYPGADKNTVNGFNLNIPRYVDTFEEEPLVDIDKVQTNIKNIEAELSEVQKKMAGYLKELWL